MRRRRFAGRRLLAAPLALLAAACTGGDSRTPLVVYSPHGRELLTAFEQRFEAAHPDVDVQWVDMGSQEVLDRIRSEKANPQADVWWGAPAEMFTAAANEGLLESSTPSWGAAVPAEMKDPRGLWYGTYETPEVIAYNSKVVAAAEAPKDWDDVLDPKWKGKVLIRDPLASGTMRTIWGMVLDRSVRQTGDTAQGMAWLRRLDAQTKEYVLNPTLLYQKLARQEGLITLWDMPDIEELQAKTKLPIDYTIPTSGTPLVVDGVAVVKGAPHTAAARGFLEYVGGTEGILMAARDFMRLPARTDIPTDSLPERLRQARAQIRPEPLDWARLQQQLPGWMRWWDEHVRGRSGG
ncbi:MAG TPA: extracellular solute-binding protein [Longimicrobiales bacterium]|nr:extracellular solute-binding protein [Longimicrobiales bacterium]